MKSLNEIAQFVKNVLHAEGADMAQFSVSTSETQEFNADGGELSLLRTLYDNNLSITAYKNHRKGSVVINNFEETAIREAITNCLQSAESGIAEFLDSILSNFTGDNVILEKTSLWFNQLQKKVADERLTISIAPLDSRITCGERYTGDGFLSQNYDVIHKGILQSFMLSLYVANKSGFKRADNTSSSFIVEGGDTPYEEMVKSIKKGLIVGSFSGGNPSTNGDFSGVAKNSFLVEDGKIAGAVNEVMINGNLAELLNNINSISKETITDGSCVLPYIAFDHVVISGK